MTGLHWVWLGLAAFAVGLSVLLIASGSGRRQAGPQPPGGRRSGRCRLSVELPYIQESLGSELADAMDRSFNATPLRVDFETPDYYDRTLSMIFTGDGVRDQPALVREFKVRLRTALEELGLPEPNWTHVRVDWV
jgi:hypothetical protein